MFNTALGDQLRKRTELGRVLARQYPQLRGKSCEEIKDALARKGRLDVTDVTINEMRKHLNP